MFPDLWKRGRGTEAEPSEWYHNLLRLRELRVAMRNEVLTAERFGEVEALVAQEPDVRTIPYLEHLCAAHVALRWACGLCVGRGPGMSCHGGSCRASSRALWRSESQCACSHTSASAPRTCGSRTGAPSP